MTNGIVMITASIWGRLFPERQIYLRSQGRVRYASIQPGTQFAGAFIILLLLSWMIFVSADFAFQPMSMSGRDARIEELRTSNLRLTSELADVQKRFSAATLELETRQRQITAMLEQKNSTRIDNARDDKTGAAESLASSDVSPAKPLIPPRPRPEARPGDFQNFQTDVMPRARPSRPAFRLPLNMTTLSDERRIGPATSYDTRLSGSSLSGSKSAENDVVAYLASDPNTAIVALEKLINQTGLDADTIIRRLGDHDADNNASGARAEGGPLLSVAPSKSVKFLRRNLPGELAMPSTRKGRLEMLREALFSLPLAEPVDKYYVSSKYGYRRDPFTHTKAFHSGMDLVAPHGAPVRSSAPGTIVFAGRNGPYGNMIEIDHGRGVKSRYAHLSKIFVAPGQKIGLRDLIGLVGNTGRSGTAHLHFEVWFDGKTRDPRNFLKAGENAFQQQG